MKRSFFFKLFVGYALLTVIMAGAILFFSFGEIRDFHIRNLTEDLTSIGIALRPAVIPLLEKNKRSELDAFLKKLDREIHARITVIAPSGTVLADSEEDPRTMENHGDRPEVKEALSSHVGSSLRYSTTVMEKMLYVAVPVSEGGRMLGVVRVSFFLKDINGFISTLKRSLVNISLLIVLLAISLALLYSRRLSKPLRMLADAARRVADGDFGTRVRLDRNDEFKGLARNFNHMTGQIQALFDELSRQKDELNTIIASLQEGLLVIDRNERVVLSNESFRKIIGQNGFQGRLYWEAMRETEFTRLIKQAFTERRSISGEAPIGDSVYLCSTSYLQAKSEIVVVMHDITEIKRLEKIKKDLAVNVSHELRTPLSAIKGYAETLEDGIDEKNRKYLDIIKRHTERLISIVEDLLSLSELEEKGAVFEQVRVRDIVQNAASVFTQKLAEKRLELKVAVGNDLPALCGDRFRLEQLFINLIDNAVKYTEKGSVEIGAAGRGDILEVYVRDTGIGISKEHLDRIFERFYVADKSRSRKLGGTGLGLSIVKHIVLLHNGAIRVDSVPGKGTTFTVSLPLNQPRQA